MIVACAVVHSGPSIAINTLLPEITDSASHGVGRESRVMTTVLVVLRTRVVRAEGAGRQRKLCSLENWCLFLVCLLNSGGGGGCRFDCECDLSPLYWVYSVISVRYYCKLDSRVGLVESLLEVDTGTVV